MESWRGKARQEWGQEVSASPRQRKAASGRFDLPVHNSGCCLRQQCRVSVFPVWICQKVQEMA